MISDFSKKNVRITSSVVMAGLLVTVSQGAFAQGAPNAPKHAQVQSPLSGEAVFELQTEHGYDSDNANNERNNTFGRMEVAPKLALSEMVSVDGVLVFEPVQGPDTPGESTFMENEGAFIEELKVNVGSGPWNVFAGKFNPGYGSAWDYGRGIWGEDFAEDYEITEKLGFGGSYALDGGNTGIHTVTGSTFFADTTYLSRSAITGRGDVDHRDGGASNTQDFSSFVIQVEGEKVAGIENLFYKLAYRDLAVDKYTAGGDDEQGILANVNYIMPISERVSTDTLVEYTNIHNFGGMLDDYEYFTASLVTTIDERWNVTAGYTLRQVDYDLGGDDKDHLFQLTGGYDFGNGLALDAGWRSTEEAGVDTGSLGALARYTYSF
ncbi:MAG: hypothetical protein K0R63_641 [Rickettsiales bacterium]|jgi:hypothetical protein|nr:hypothetical protein [Rickettsiales bacterium]